MEYDRGKVSKTLTRLHERYDQLMLKTAFQILHSESMSQDVVSETYITLATLLRKEPNRIQDIEARQTANFLITIVKHKSFNMLRSRKKLISFDEQFPYDSSAQVPFTNEIELQEARVLLYDEIKRLDSRYRTVVTLYYLNDCSISDIAAILDISEGNAKVLLHRARAKLREVMVRYENE